MRRGGEGLCLKASWFEGKEEEEEAVKEEEEEEE